MNDGATICVTIHHTTQQQKYLNVTTEPPELSVVQRKDLIDSTSTIIRGRKRVRNVKNWKRNSEKTRRNSRSEYIGRAGRIKHAKVVQPAEHACRYKCCKNVTEDEREKNFNNFWQLSDWQHQTCFILSSVSEIPVKRKKKDATKHKQSIYIFTLLNCRVCRDFFLKC